MTITPPYADPGRAAFEELDTYVQSRLIAGSHPEMAPAVGVKMPNNANYKQFSVLGKNASGELVMATHGFAAAVAANAALTFAGTGAADDTITIDNVVYTLKASVSAANEVLIGASATATAENLVAAINAAAGAGTAYGSGTDAHPTVTAANAAGVVTVTARNVGVNGNEIGFAESSADASWAGSSLSGGRDQAGVQARYVLAHAASLGATGTANGQVWYTGNYNPDMLVWDPSFDDDAKKLAAFEGAPSPSNILVTKRS